MDLNFTPAFKEQADFLYSDSDITAFIAGVGSGKTHIGADRAILISMLYPEANGLVVANTYDQLNSATINMLLQRLDDHGIPFKHNKADKTIQLQLPNINTGTIYYRSLDKPDTIRGMEAAWLWLDETRDTTRYAYEVVDRRVRQQVDRKTRKVLREKVYTDIDTGVTTTRDGTVVSLLPTLVWITTTPNILTGKWLYDLLYDEKVQKEFQYSDLSIKTVHAKTAQNKENLAPGYIEKAKALMSDQQFKQEMEGEWVIIPPGTPVFGKEFNNDTHTTRTDFADDLPLIIGFDWGYHRPAAIFLQEDTVGRATVLGEYLGDTEEIAEFMENVLKYIHTNFVQLDGFVEVEGYIRPKRYDGKELIIEAYCDPAGNQVNDKSTRSSVEIAQDFGFYCFSVPSQKKNQIQDSINYIRFKLKKLIQGIPALRFDVNRCLDSIIAMNGGYHYPELRNTKTQEQKNVPFKDGYYDHLMDALRYIAINRWTYVTDFQRTDYAPPKQLIINKEFGW